MLKTLIQYFLLAGVCILFGNLPSFAQETVSPEKKELIDELRPFFEGKMTGYSFKLSDPEIKNPMADSVAEDKELTDAQKTELGRAVSESNERIKEKLKKFNSDQSMLDSMAQEAVYQAYVKTFTEDEIRELIDFYQTSAGRKSLAFAQSVKKQIAAAIDEIINRETTKFLMPLFEREIKELQDKIKQMKAKTPPPVEG